jgi:ectoine hydroxylase-related dioxygenase (phytanoyl-CoA dioxygenase family)
MPEYYSRFGGLWIDQTQQASVAARLDRIENPGLRAAMQQFIRDGYVVIPSAVSPAMIDAYLAEYELAADQPEALQIEVPMEGGRQAFSRAKSLKPGAKVLDTAMLMPHGQHLSFAPSITTFLQVLFESKALAFQTLHFEVGSTQAIHQDTAYVVVDRSPLALAASWIALEDIQAGTGELIFHPGGHRVAEHLYNNGLSKHWNPQRDGQADHDAHLQYLREVPSRAGLKTALFRPRKGDALIWHADLPHGGGPITNPGTRRSLVSHYCPIGQDPYYMQFLPPDARRKVPVRDGNAFCSLYFPPDRLSGLR